MMTELEEKQVELEEARGLRNEAIAKRREWQDAVDYYREKIAQLELKTGVDL
jgi:uncharacterized coiled-coil DUF342 family protein